MKRMLKNGLKKGVVVLASLFGLLVTLALVYSCWLEFASQRGLRDTKRQMRAEGLPLTPAELNRPLPPADQNAAPLYLQLSELLAKHPLAGEDKVLDEGTKQLPPSPEYIAGLRRALQHRQDILRLIHQAAQKPQCVFRRDYALGPDLPFPEFKDMRAGLRILSSESLVLLADGKTSDAVRNESLGYRMAQHACSDPTLISKLMGIALNAMTDKFMDRVLYTAGNQPGVPELVEQIIAADWKPVVMADGMRGEIVMNGVVCQMLREGRTSLVELSGTPTADTNAAPKPVGRHVSFVWKAMIDASELGMLRYMRRQM